MWYCILGYLWRHVLLLMLQMKSASVTIQMKAFNKYFHLVPFDFVCFTKYNLFFFLVFAFLKMSEDYFILSGGRLSSKAVSSTRLWRLPVLKAV